MLREARESVEIQATQVIGGQRVCVDLAAALVDVSFDFHHFRHHLTRVL